jgi:hypothetical protein
MENEYHGEALFRSNPNCVYVLEVISQRKSTKEEEEEEEKKMRWSSEPFNDDSMDEIGPANDAKSPRSLLVVTRNWISDLHRLRCCGFGFECNHLFTSSNETIFMFTQTLTPHLS